ncbi:MAG: hypothetical protein KKH01_04170 [Firmicutes bacterium]|nr:hypothetical protein [Bacillota bacterium]
MKKFLLASLLFLASFFSLSFINVQAVPILPPTQPTYIEPIKVSSPIQNVYYSWHSPMSTYNCYGYALGVNQDLTPGYSINDAWVASDGIFGLKSKVMADLVNLGYANVREVSASFRPTVSTEYLVAFRTGYIIDYQTEFGYEGYTDFHFMKYNQEQDNWFGKPGHTAVLHLMVETAISNSWVFEYYKVYSDPALTGWYRHPLSSYNGPIVYVAYRESTLEDPIPLFE